MSKWLHKGLRSHNVLFFKPHSIDEISFVEPSFIGFGPSWLDRLLESSIGPGENEEFDLSRHLDSTDPTTRLNLPYRRKYGIYSLWVMLLEIGYWELVCG